MNRCTKEQFIEKKILRAEGLAKKYRGRSVVDDVFLEIHEGEVVGLLGPNGAGKTTCFYLILGLVPPEEGKIFLNGEDITDLPMYVRARKGIGYLPQEASAFRKMTVEENLIAILETLNLPREEIRSRCDALLKEFRIAHLSKNRTYSLSGGERRRVEIARALVLSPHFMLLDEPFAGIDPIAVSDIQKIVSLLKEKGIGILITDHNVRETLQITDRAYIINMGRIFREGDPAKLTNDPDVRKIYLGDRFSL
ncbi:MAG: LPS export ABC transporter ATP-binding protein [Acidobacteriota bacterium]